MLLHKFLVVMWLLSTLWAPGSSQAAPLYTASFLPGVDFVPTGMNNAGQIVGFAGTGTGAIHTMLYAGGVLSDLGSMGGRESYALAINEAGDLTGGLLTANGEEHAFLYRNGHVTALGGGTVGYGINARGEIVGKKQTANGWTGFLFSDGKLTELGNLGTGLDGFAVDINDHGKIVGESRLTAETPPPARHPFLYRQGVMTDLGALAGGDGNGAVAINNSGQVAGYSEGADGFTHAFLYQHGAMQDLGGFAEAALDIHDLNERGTLVGTASNEEEGLIPFMNLGGALVDLNTLLDPALGWHIFSAHANNDLGQIVAYGCRAEACGLVRLDLAGAVPEPGPVSLLASGSLLTAGMVLLDRLRRRERRPGHGAPANGMGAQRGRRRTPAYFFATTFLIRPTMLLHKILATTMLAAMLTPLASQAGPHYTVAQVVPSFTAYAINNHGQMGGSLFGSDGARHAGSYFDGVYNDLGAMGGTESYATAINDAGAMTGTVFNGPGDWHGFVFANGVSTALASRSEGDGINAHGDVVGRAATGFGTYTAMLYSAGQMTLLGGLGTGDYDIAYDINDLGQVVGLSLLVPESHAPFHPFLYSDGLMHDLGSLMYGGVSSANAINNAGRIAGFSEGPDSKYSAFVNDNGTMTFLGNFGGSFLDVGDINEHGAFVGTATTADDLTIGYIYLDGALVDLNTLLDPASGWHIESAVGINDSGQIAAYGCQPTWCSTLRLDVANAVPEPAAAGMLIPGLLALAAARRRQRRPATLGPWRGTGAIG